MARWPRPDRRAPGP